jgi:hypothetical protein
MTNNDHSLAYVPLSTWELLELEPWCQHQVTMIACEYA